MFNLFQRLTARPGAAMRGEPSRARDERLRAAIAAAPVGIALTGFDGQWLFFNDAAAALLGYTREELRRVSLHEITHPGDRERELDFLRRMTAGEMKRYEMDKRVVDKLGKPRPIVVSAALVPGPRGEDDSIVYVLEPRQPAAEGRRAADDFMVARLREELQTERTAAATMSNIVETLRSRVQAEVARATELEQEIVALRERLANAEAAATPEWTPFADRGPLDLIEEHARAGRTGLLLFANGSRQTSVYLEDGCIASCASNERGRTLGERLVRGGAITEAGRDRALEMSEATNVTLGRALVLLGALSEEAVAEAVREKIDRELSDLESWPAGRWTFVPRTPPRVKPVRVALPLAALRQFARAEYVASRNGTRYHRPDCTAMLRVHGNERMPVLSAHAGAERGLSPCRMCIA